MLDRPEQICLLALHGARARVLIASYSESDEQVL